MALLAWIIIIGIFCGVVSIQTGTECNQALGMESGAIPNRKITASSSLNERRSPWYARLHQRDGDGGWTADPNDGMMMPSLTVDLGYMARVIAVATQGRYGSNEYVEQYKLAYSESGHEWQFVMNGDTEKIFVGNTNGEAVVKQTLADPIDARYIRFMPTSHNSAISMRAELYGCLTGVKSASFDGSNYLKYDLSAPKETLALNEELIDFRFLTSEPNGIILSGYGTQGDFIVFSLEKGKLRLSLNLGTSMHNDGTTMLVVGSLLDDNQWHYGRYVRDGRRIALYVDRAKVKGMANGDFVTLDLDREITIGGASDTAKFLHKVDQNFVGCLQLVRISNSARPSLLGIALDVIKEVVVGGRLAFSSVGALREGCYSSDDTTSVTFPTVGSYLKWTVQGSFNNLTVHVRFRTFDDDALILYNAMIPAGFILVGLRNSVLVVVIKQDSASQPVDLPASSGLNDGLWHRVRVEVAGGMVLITVDGTKQSSIRNTGFVSTSTEFYIGGSGMALSETAYLPGFRGCISEIHLENVMVDIMSLVSGSAPAGVSHTGLQIDTCTLFDWCSPNPCEHNGQCLSDWDTFVCDCTGTGYEGAICHTSGNEHLCEQVGVSGDSTIDVDGSGPLEPFTVTCNIEAGTAYHWTEISHDTETSMAVPAGYEEAGSFTRGVEYEAMLGQIVRLIDSSEECEQHIRYQCSSAKLLNSPNGPPYGWWVSRHDQKMVNWGGAVAGTGRCACGISMTCLPDSAKYCNCDASSTSNAVDEGLLTEKDYLPVTQLRFGDTGGTGSSASYQLGKLRCRGDANLNNMVSFVAREAHLTVDVETTLRGALDITLDFKTTVDPTGPGNPASAAVFFAASAEDEGLIEVKLVNDRTVQLQFDYGADLTTITSTVRDPLNDDAWHSIRASFDRKEVWLQVDKNSKEIEMLVRPELTLELTSPLFVGSSTVQSDGFVGCLRKMTINGELVDMVKRAERARDVLVGCVGQCSVEPCLNGGRCIERYDVVDCECSDTAFVGDYCSVEVGVEMSSGSEIFYDLPISLQQSKETDTINLAFKTTQTGGQLFRVENSQDQTYIDLALDSSGHVVLKLKLDSGAEKTMRESKNFADNRNHFVQVRRTMKKVHFQVDDYVQQRQTFNDLTTTTFTPAKFLIGDSESNGKSFEGCISRIRYNTLFPLKMYISTNRPSGFTETGLISRSRCGIEEELPMLLPPQEYPPTTGGPTTIHVPSAAPVSSHLAAGDKAAIAIVVILLLLALFLLLFLIGRYTSRHKGMYSTNEDKGAKHAQTADDAVALQGSKRTKEFYM